MFLDNNKTITFNHKKNMSAYMIKYAVLRVNTDTFEFEVNVEDKLSREDLQRTTIVITSSEDENNDSYALSCLRPIWNYNNKSKMLIDREGVQLPTDSTLEILRVVNLFDSVREALNESLIVNSDKSTRKRINTLVSSLAKNRISKAKTKIQELKLQNIGITQELTLKKDNITQELEDQQSTLRGKNIIIGIRDKTIQEMDSTIQKYEKYLLEIEKIVSEKQPINTFYSKKIKQLMDENPISNKLSNKIKNELEKKYFLVKKRTIVALIKDSGVRG